MILEERLLKKLYTIHSSEKTSSVLERVNTVVLKVARDTSKKEIKTIIQRLFKVELEAVNTLIVKGKVKFHSQRIGRRSNWKKAYITLKKGQNLDFISNAK